MLHVSPSFQKPSRGIEDLKKVVDSHRSSITPFVNYDNRGAVVTASFVEDKLDYKSLFDGIQNLIHKYQDDNTATFTWPASRWWRDGVTTTCPASG